MRDYRWMHTPDSLARLAAYNAAQARAHAERWRGPIARMVRRAFGLEPMTPEEAERAYDEAEPVPISAERIAEMVRYATGGEPRGLGRRNAPEFAP